MYVNCNGKTNHRYSRYSNNSYLKAVWDTLRNLSTVFQCFCHRRLISHWSHELRQSVLTVVNDTSRNCAVSINWQAVSHWCYIITVHYTQFLKPKVWNYWKFFNMFFYTVLCRLCAANVPFCGRENRKFFDDNIFLKRQIPQQAARISNISFFTAGYTV
jgi:hypothetical protein